MGTKGEREYEWALVRFGILTDQGKQRSLLVRRSIADHSEMAYYFTLTPPRTPLRQLIGVAGSRWAIELTADCADFMARLIVA